MTLSFDIFWSFRSPYCYFTLDRILDLVRNYDVEVNVRPIYPLAVRVPDIFKRLHPSYRRYHLMDSKRVAEYLGIPYRRPTPDPIVQNLETNEIAAEQPYIYRITRLGIAAVQEGRGLAFLDQVARIMWDGSVDNWHEAPHLPNAVSRAGLDLESLDRAIAAEPAKYDAVIAENRKLLESSGHWGVPTMLFEDEPFFGQDRLNLLVWRMKQKGLRKRA